MKFFPKLIIAFVVIAFILFNIFVITLFLYPVPKVLKSIESTDTVKIYDRNEELLYEVLNEETGRQTFVELDTIPQSLKNAFISIEDKNFYEHGGVDFSAILRAIWQNVSAGEIVSGGSTITQQVVRNIIGINKERTLPQKIKESILALKIGKFLDKDEVFEIYLNTIYFGGLAYGVESASWQYFDKSVVNLDLAESAFLAGLPQAPNRYNPFRNFDSAKKRQALVLEAMLDGDVISESEFEQAKDEYINLKQSSRSSKQAPHFVDYVIAEEGLSNLPNKVVTTLDLGIQNRTENILQSDITFLNRFNIENAAVVILDAKKGDILAMVGSVDYNNESIDGEVNVISSLRQPGSSIKPLIYASALENGWSVDTIIVDEPVQFETVDGLPYSPKNFDLTYHGKVTVAESLAQSLNIPAVKTMDYIGVESFLNTAKGFGLSTFDKSPEHYGLSLALGSGEVKLLELTNAYSAFANDGNRISVRYLKSDKNISESVIKSKTASTISAILSSNDLRMPAFGEENPLKLPFRVAAKTGTTRNFRDNWTIGFTDDYVVGVWVGNASGEVMEGVSGISGAGPIFYKIMNMLNEETGTVLTKGKDVKLPVISANSTNIIISEGQDMHPDIQENGLFDDFRIISPFSNDVYQYDPNKPSGYQKIQLQASEPAQWYVNGQFVGEGAEILWGIVRGQHEIRALSDDKKRFVNINVR